MQIVGPVPGGIKAYLKNPRCLLGPKTRGCPFCPDRHPLRLHGFYKRCVLLPRPPGEVKVRVLRLLCARKGKTVSLLPGFCLPRRQHGPEILGHFLDALVFQGLALLAALRRARPGAASHSVAQSLRDGFLSRREELGTYLSARRRVQSLPSGVPWALRQPATFIQELRRGFSDAASAFLHHGWRFHAKFNLGLA